MSIKLHLRCLIERIVEDKTMNDDLKGATLGTLWSYYDIVAQQEKKERAKIKEEEEVEGYDPYLYYRLYEDIPDTKLWEDYLFNQEFSIQEGCMNCDYYKDNQHNMEDVPCACCINNCSCSTSHSSTTSSTSSTKQVKR